MGTVYLLHFDEKLAGHAGHYTGYTDGAVSDRLARHRQGRGARIMEVIAELGIGFTLARTWENVTWRAEKIVKGHKNAPLLCPICNPRAFGRLSGLGGRKG